MNTKLFLLLNVTILNIFAQAPNWQWAKSAGASAANEAYSVVTDVSGNVFVTGRFTTPSIVFGSTTLTNTDNTGSTEEIFLVKYSASGSVLWAKKAGGATHDGSNWITADISGNVFIVGYFKSPTIVFGSFTLTNTDATGNTSDLFFVKYDTAGNVTWAKSAGGSSNDEAFSVTTNNSGNIFIAGSFQSSALLFGSTSVSNNYTGYADLFIVKYDAAGNALWAKSTGGSYYDRAFSVATDSLGNVLVAGYFSSPTIAFGSTTLTNPSSAFSDMFLAKYDAAGNVLWAKSAGGSSSDYANSIATDAAGNVFVTGQFQNTIVFGSTALTALGTDMFLVKYSPSGNIIWAYYAGGSSDEDANSVTTDAAGNIFVTGMFQSASIIFGSVNLTNASTGNADMYIVKYDSTGTVLWAKNAGGSGSDEAQSVAIDASGNLYVAGSFYSSAITFGSTTLTQGGNFNMFVSKLGTLTGIGIIENKKDIYIYPNPFTSSITISLNDKLQNSILTIYNTFGQQIMNIDIIGEKTNVLRGDLPSGIYFIQLIKGDEIIATDKLIITDYQ